MGKSFKNSGTQAVSKFISKPSGLDINETKEESSIKTNKEDDNDSLEINKINNDNCSEKVSSQVLDIKYLTTKEVAEILRITPRRIQQLINQNKIQANRIGRKWLIPENEARRFINGNE